jgi:two-component system sensor histidine kinase VicK
MFRSLHMKLVMILVLLITSLMAVVGAFLMTSVTNFYIDEFYTQMNETFSDASFYSAMQTEAAQEDGAQRLQSLLELYAGSLGIDSRSRNYYILDADNGAFLAGSDEAAGASLRQTANILAARNGSVGAQSDLTASYMDVAVPVSGGENRFIVYIRDNRATVSELNNELLLIILQALLVGLLVSVLLSFLLAKTMIDPIEKLTEGAERIAGGDFDEQLEVESNDEIGVLTNTFNDMASVLHDTLSAVENERSKLDALFLHMTDGVVAYDGGGKLMHCNPAAVALLDRAPEDCVYAELFEPLCPFSRVMSMKRGDYAEAELTVGERSVELYFAAFSDEEAGGVLIVLHDVTERRRTEERRKEFVANVSHELRTPLTNIRSYAETIRDANGDIPRETENGFLDIVINEADRMTHIVQDLLTLSRLDSGRTEMVMARFAFGDAIDAVLRSIALDARRHGHTLTRDYSDRLPYILGDRGRIEQVMLNILSNAVKYTPDGGHIRVTAGDMGERVWMEVADDGIGIPKKDRKRIFERFYRVDKARSRESGGTGLGLSIATEIVQRHNGSLSIVDRDGPGTTVRLELPVRPGEGAPS